jgi:shikimate dehydrogenase
VGRVGDHSDVTRAELVVNATSVGMAGSPAEGALPVDAGLLHAGQVVVDLIYHPVETPLLAAARARGAVAVNGVGMLVHQAAHAFVRWTGEAPPLREMATAIRHELGRRAPSDGSPSHG